MKFCKSIGIFLILLLPIISQAQDIRLSDIPKPGEIGNAFRIGIVLGENLLGPYKVVFSGNAPGDVIPTLSREETGLSGAGIGSFDKLATLYSGKIYSPTNMSEPFIFENKTPEQLIQMEIPIFPTILEQPYTLYLDITVQASTKPIIDKFSDDAGEYVATLTISLIKL